MREYDWDGDMSYFQDQLAVVGIEKDALNMDNYAGCTFQQLQGIVASVIRAKKKGADDNA